jgi:hypothetical protein
LLVFEINRIIYLLQNNFDFHFYEFFKANSHLHHNHLICRSQTK